MKHRARDYLQLNIPGVTREEEKKKEGAVYSDWFGVPGKSLIRVVVFLPNLIGPPSLPSLAPPPTTILVFVLLLSSSFLPRKLVTTCQELV